MGGTAPDNRSWDAPDCPECESEVFVDPCPSALFTHRCQFCGTPWDESDRPDEEPDSYMAVPADDAHLPANEPPTKRAIVGHIVAAMEAMWADDYDEFERELMVAHGQYRKRIRESGVDE